MLGRRCAFEEADIANPDPKFFQMRGSTETLRTKPRQANVALIPCSLIGVSGNTKSREKRLILAALLFSDRG